MKTFLWAAVVLFGLLVGCTRSPYSPGSRTVGVQQKELPSSLRTGSVTLVARHASDEAFSFALERTVTSGGDLSFRSDYNPHFGYTPTWDCGPVPLTDVNEVPREEPSSCPVKEGHTYCVEAIDSGGYAKLRVTKFVEGTFESSVSFDYVYQTNGTRSFVAEPAVHSPLELLHARRSDLEKRITTSVPDFREMLEKQATEVRAELAKTSSQTAKDALQNELREVARTLVALDAYERESQETLRNLGAATRRLQRTEFSEEHLGEDAEKMLAEAHDLEQEAAGKLEVKLGMKLGEGAIQDTLIDEKLRELGQ